MLERKILILWVKFIGCGLAIGFISAIFAKLVEYAFNEFLYISNTIGYGLLVYIPLLMLLIVYLQHRFFPEAEGSGVPQALAIDYLSAMQIQQIFRPRAIFSKIFLIVLGTLSGGTLGREGSTIQIGASLGLLLGVKLNLDAQKCLLKIGAASGLAAAFNTPLAGIVFALEELLINHKSILLKLSIIALSGIAATLILGNYSYFGQVSREMLDYSDWIFISACLIGIMAGVFSMVFTRLARILLIDVNPITKFRRIHPYYSVLIFGLLAAIIGILSHGLSFGNGYYESRGALSGEIVLGASYPFYKILSALFTTAASVPGGYFATALAIGEGVGALFHHVFAVANLEECYLLGMVAFLAGFTRAPITAIVMVVQITTSQIFTLPLIIAALSATFIAKLGGAGIYEYQIEKYTKNA